MTEKRKLIKNISLGFCSQLITLFLSFFIRSFFVKYLGIELLGISGVIASLIQTLSLTEIGFQAAVIFRLYKPLSENDLNLCNDYLNIFRIIYEIIAGIIFVLVIVLIPFIPIFFKEIEVNKTVYITYILMGSNTFFSYLLAYKRTLIYADRKDYIAKITDTAINILLSIIKIIVIYYYRNFYIYTALTIVQTILSNVIINIYCKRIYTWLHKVRIRKDLLKLLLKDTSVIFGGRLASYVLFSTDNLVISSFISTAMVGLYSNYTIIYSALQGVYSSIVQQVVPFIGREFAITQEIEHHQKIIQLYTFIRFILAGSFCIPFTLLINYFISWWLGELYIIDGISYLVAIHLYIQIVYSTLTDYISCSGSFKYDRNNSLIGAFVNILSSIIFVNYFGIKGVLYGTILSEIITWFFCGYVVFTKIIKSERRFVLLYAFRNILYFCIVVVVCIVSSKILVFVNVNIFIFSFILKAILSIFIFYMVCIIFFSRSIEMKYLGNLLKRKIRGNN